MSAILRREVKNYMKGPLFWIGILIVLMGVYGSAGPYLKTRYLQPEEKIINHYPETVYEAEVCEGYVPTPENQRREIWEKQIKESLISVFEMGQGEAETVINEMRDMDIVTACDYLEEKYHYKGAFYVYEDSAYHKGTNEEINSYLSEKLENKTFSYYFSRKFADFSGLFMGFFATVLLSVLFIQDTRKHTYELLHTKPVSAGKYVAGKALGGFLVCLTALVILNLVFWALCLAAAAGSGFEVRLYDFIAATCLYILPNMLMIVAIYGLISLLFRNPLPAAPLLILYLVYSNMGSRNAEGEYGYFGRPLAIMVRFPGQLFDTAPPPMALLNQSFLVIASIGVLLISIQLWKRRRL